MTAKKTNIQKEKKDPVTKKVKLIVKEEVKRTVKKDVNSTIREFFYRSRVYNEYLISALERSFKEIKKTDKEWTDLLSKKGIVF